MTRLSVNVNKVALLRNARDIGIPSVTEAARIIGKKLAELAVEKGLRRVIFDRNRYRYHGRIKAVAEGAREGGLEF